MPSKATTKRVLQDTALHALASCYSDTHRMHIADNDLNALFLRAAEEIHELRKERGTMGKKNPLIVFDTVEGEDPISEDGMPARVTLRRLIDINGIPTWVDRVYTQLTDAETDALDLLWGLVYPGKTDWEYPAQVFRHVRDVMEGLQIQLAQIGLACDKAQVPERKTVLERVRMMASYFVVKATGVRFDAKELQQIRFGGKDK